MAGKQFLDQDGLTELVSSAKSYAQNQASTVKNSLLDHKKTIARMLKETDRSGDCCCFSHIFRVAGKYLVKDDYYVAWNLFALLDDNPQLTPEHKEICLRIKNEQMPAEYIWYLKGLIQTAL